MRWVATAAGIALIATASIILARNEYLYSTRHAVHLTAPISSSPGRVSTGDFRVDVPQIYQITIQFEKPMAIPSEKLDCLVGLARMEPKVNCGDIHSILKTKWTLYRGHNAVRNYFPAEGNGYWSGGPVVTLGTFHGEYGQLYALDLDVLSDLSELAPAEPHLVVKVADWEYYEDREISHFLMRLAAGGLILLGVMLTIPAIARARKRRKLSR